MRRRISFRPAALALLVLLFSAAASAEEIVLTLIPANGQVSGPAGSTVGWGCTITNNTNQWLQTESLSAGTFADGTADAIFDFPAVSPNTSVTESFSLVASASCGSPPCGLYEFTWNSNAPVGTVNAGAFVLSSDFFSGDPANPSSIDLGPTPDADASYSASALAAVVPEPATLSFFVSRPPFARRLLEFGRVRT